MERISEVGRARWPDPPVGELEVKYEAFSPWESYKILETDYSNYAVAYSCYTRMGIWNHDHLWVMTRQPAEIGSKLWKAYQKVAIQAIQRLSTTQLSRQKGQTWMIILLLRLKAIFRVASIRRRLSTKILKNSNKFLSTMEWMQSDLYFGSFKTETQ